MTIEQRGFIQIPILIAIVIGAFVFGGIGYYAAERGKAPDSKTETTLATTTPQTATTTASESSKTEQKKEAAPSTSATVKTKVETPPVKTEVVVQATNYKEAVVASINAQIDSYKAITNWIDGDMLPLLSQRESMLNNLISTTNGLMASESDASVDYAYSLFIQAYNGDISQIVRFYRNDIFGEIKNHINSQKLPALNADLAKFSSKTAVSEAEYNAEIQALAQYQTDWQSLYTGGVKAAMTQYMSQTDTRDEMYQRLWSDLSAAVSDLKKTQALQSSLSQLYAQQPRQLNCTFSSHFNGFGTVGSLSCY